MVILAIKMCEEGGIVGNVAAVVVETERELVRGEEWRSGEEYTAPILGTVSIMSENLDWTTAAKISKQSRAD